MKQPHVISLKIVILKNTCAIVFFLHKFADLLPVTLLKIRPQHKVFYCKHLETFYEHIFNRILLDGCFWLQSETKIL